MVAKRTTTLQDATHDSEDRPHHSTADRCAACKVHQMHHEGLGDKRIPTLDHHRAQDLRSRKITFRPSLTTSLHTVRTGPLQAIITGTNAPSRALRTQWGVTHLVNSGQLDERRCTYTANTTRQKSPIYPWDKNATKYNPRIYREVNGALSPR